MEVRRGRNSHLRITDSMRSAEKLLDKKESKQKRFERSVLQGDNISLSSISPKKVNVSLHATPNNGSNKNSAFPINLQHMSPARRYNATVRNQKQHQMASLPTWNSSQTKINNDLEEVCNSKYRGEGKRKSQRDGVDLNEVVDEIANGNNEDLQSEDNTVTVHRETDNE